MNKRELKFMLAYAEAYGLMNWSLYKVQKAIESDNSIQDYLDYFDVPMECYIEDFLKAFNAIKEAHLESKCFKIMMQWCGNTIWEAASEFGLIEDPE